MAKPYMPMLPEHQSPSHSGRDLHILSVCPLCKATYNPLKTQVMAERDDAHLLYLECRQCGSAVVAVVTNGVAGLTSVGTVTDLTSTEIADFPSREQVDADDVIELYACLNREGHIHQILGREKD